MNIFAGTSDGVFLSTNYGSNWNAVNSGVINGAYIQDLTLLVNDKGDTSLFAGTDWYGIWQHPFSKYIPTISLDYCRLEFDLSAGILNQTKSVPLKITTGSLTPLIIDSVYTLTKWFAVASFQDTVARGDTVSLLITFTPNTEKDTVYLDTLYIVSNSIYPLTKVPLTGRLTVQMLVSQNISDIPKNYGISQNYPNPFNPTTVINYQLPVSSVVTLKVYDILGREIATLVNAKITAGYHSASFNGEHLSSGIYFYRLQADSYIQTKKLILLK